MPNYVFRDGSRLTPAMLQDVLGLDSDFNKEFGLHLLCTSAIRTRDEQAGIFRQRYVPLNQVNGRRVYDLRRWQGILWARISSAGTVAAPDSLAANHVLENTGSGAVDFRDNGTDAGVTRFGTARTKWLQANAPRHNFYPEGRNFNEAWHYKYMVNPWRVVASSPIQDHIDEVKEIADMGDAFVVSYGGQGRNGIVLASLSGRWKQFTSEQWKNQKIQDILKGCGVKVYTPTNDREYDIIRDLVAK